MKYSKEVKTALLALVAILLFIFGYSFLKGKNWFDSSRTFYAVYNDVEGLTPSSPVTINGLEVGNVTDISFLDTSGRLVVTFTVDNDFPFAKSSVAQIYGGGLIGGKSVAILPKYEQGNMAKSGDTLESAIEEGLLELVNERLTPLQEKVEKVIVSTDSLVNAFNQVLNEETRKDLKNSIENLSLTVASLRSTAKSADKILSENSPKFNRTFTNLDEMTTNLNNFSDTLAQVDLKRMTNDLETAVSNFEDVTNKLNNGDGTAARLINDPTVYNNLERATNQLDELIQDIKLNPKRYVHFSIFGKNPGPYSPPKDSLK
ncbi:phospholipid/cholesterol/gamma-HCH transport system substrate-binding protein [Salinimicrobium catena]|uniref:Phospholipid/cholesterol/gamma-HCH transport system substrate-binding protein n=1 Tax=Salinimicrobium catena TaxID=390640 RepID=A0A1H5LQE3_9FLAO|nr:MlaD family protein [Salinimicrobium catena]SDL12120.1 phospholipid/cholesterol/gamma-HCH transport system substrate-binding protein [Salinimicrobium catena]SEE78621.1 phospholipid/cholesterol/gamma-HCH transport system substrate-binding protein [Salinimicrobium catena]